MGLKYKPSKASKDAEKLIKGPFIAEHNAMSLKFQSEEISPKEWGSFEKDWEKRFFSSMNNVLKDRTYEIDNEGDQ